ncbi:hypothetical protein L218DRAFT_929996 [Marasmius fiardii PR-910]|nr:hypothetical protein L218DRAFT_929996 [Marasmius fiardii PR-910]
MAFGNAALRRAGYFALSLFAIILLGLCATRINNTLKAHFHERIVAELLASAALTILWSWFIFHAIHARREGGFISTFRGEMIGSFILWILLLVGAAIATSNFGDLSGCNSFSCMLITALIAFAWITWGTLTLLMLTSALYATVHTGWDDPMHARWAPRAGTTTYAGKNGTTTAPRV